MDLVKTCAGFGHSDVYEDISLYLHNAVQTAIELGCEEFLCGGMGAFDRKFAGAVRRAKIKNPEKNIKLTLVIPYFTKELQDNRDFYSCLFDEIVFPEELEGVYPKSAIVKRNRWMVDKSEMIISYIKYEFGGAYNTIRYAQKKNKYIVNTKSNKLSFIDKHYFAKKSVDELENDRIFNFLFDLEIKKTEKKMEKEVLHPIEKKLREESMNRVHKNLSKQLGMNLGCSGCSKSADEQKDSENNPPVLS